MDRAAILRLVEDRVKETSHTEAAHDWWHIFRVNNLSKKICAAEKADEFRVSMIALLHDVFDWKINPVDNEKKAIEKYLSDIGVSKFIIEKDLKIIAHDSVNISFKGGGSRATLSLDGQVAQDADRLDALGAIGIARAFTYGGAKNREIYCPDTEIMCDVSPEEYQNPNRKMHTIQHFYEKLLKLKSLMNTETGHKMAEHRHKVMEKFLDEFYKEWEGIK